jgi:mycothiol synthase
MIKQSKQNTQTSLPGGLYTLPASLADAPAVANLANSCSQVQLGIDETSPEEIVQEWQAPGFDFPGATQLVWAPGSQLVGYIEVLDQRKPPVAPMVWGRVHPDFENQGIGSWMMAWAEARCRHCFREVPDGARVSMLSGALSTHLPSIQLMEGYGMQPLRQFWRMETNLANRSDVPAWPTGIVLQPYRHPQDAWQVYLAYREAFKDHWGQVPEPYESGFERWKHLWFTAKSFDPALWFLAMDGEKIAGFALCRREAYDNPRAGYVNSLGVRRAWRMRGLGLALLLYTFTIFQSLGREQVALNVDGENLTGAIRLYTKAGMQVTRQWNLYEKELQAGFTLDLLD